MSTASIESRPGQDARSAPERRPTISVIIAVRNGAATLQAALDSVFAQTMTDWELVVIDGASRDGTVDIIERNASRIAHWRSEPDTGVYNAWNKGVAAARGSWICFLGADDRYNHPEVFSTMAAAFDEAYPAVPDGARIVYGKLRRTRPDGSVVYISGRRWTKAQRRRFLRGVMIPHPSTFHHRAVFEERGPFDERFAIAGDYELLLRELPFRAPLFVDTIVVDMLAGGLSNRKSTAVTVVREVYLARYRNGRVKTPPWRAPRLWLTMGRVWYRAYVKAPIASAVPRRRAGQS